MYLEAALLALCMNVRLFACLAIAFKFLKSVVEYHYTWLKADTSWQVTSILDALNLKGLEN